jgi:hypothetical protein
MSDPSRLEHRADVDGVLRSFALLPLGIIDTRYWTNRFIWGGGGHQELPANALQSTQPKTTESDSVFKFTEWRYHFPAVSLMAEECGLWVPSLSHFLFHMDNELHESAGNAFSLFRTVAALCFSRSIDFMAGLMPMS